MTARAENNEANLIIMSSVHTASICTIGDEILIGQIVDTNSSAITRELGALGIRTSRMISIGDDHEIGRASGRERG